MNCTMIAWTVWIVLVSMHAVARKESCRCVHFSMMSNRRLGRLVLKSLHLWYFSSEQWGTDGGRSRWFSSTVEETARSRNSETFEESRQRLRRSTWTTRQWELTSKPPTFWTVRIDSEVISNDPGLAMAFSAANSCFGLYSTLNSICLLMSLERNVRLTSTRRKY